MDIATQFPLAANDGGWIGLVVFALIWIVGGILKALATAREKEQRARDHDRLKQELEEDRKHSANRPSQSSTPTGGPTQAPRESNTGGGSIYYPPAQRSAPAAPPPLPQGRPVQTAPARQPMPVPQQRPAPVAQQRPAQRTPARQAAPAPAANEPPQAVLLLRQVEQQIGILEGNLEKLQARRAQLSALTGVRVRRPVVITPAAMASTLNLDMQNPSNVRQGIIVSEILRPPVGLRDGEEGSWMR